MKDLFRNGSRHSGAETMEFGREGATEILPRSTCQVQASTPDSDIIEIGFLSTHWSWRKIAFLSVGRSKSAATRETSASQLSETMTDISNTSFIVRETGEYLLY